MTSIRKRGNPGLKGQLIEKSIEAFVLSLETINRLSIKYRVETFTYLICNSWELLLKAKIIDDSKSRKAIYYPPKMGYPNRSLSLRDCLQKVFTNTNDPIRRNLEFVSELRDESVHLVISFVPSHVFSLFQSCVLNYHKKLVEWFQISLSDRVPVGMMTIIYDFGPEEVDLSSSLMKRKIGKEAIAYLTGFENLVSQESRRLNGVSEFSINIGYKLALIKNPADADIVLSSGVSDASLGIIEVAKDSSRTHPYRQKEVVEYFNSSLGQSKKISPYDVQCMNTVYEIKRNSNFFYQGRVKGSPAQYSLSFVTWLIDEFTKDNEFFVNARRKAKEMRAKNTKENSRSE
ncbi:MAG: DUF3644 domain-containing protein [Anaerolineaceae bacterium]